MPYSTEIFICLCRYTIFSYSMPDMVFSDIKKPHIAFIKLIEAIGIIFGTPKISRSKYKAPSPSNYDNTIELLDKEFSSCLLRLSCTESTDISSETASELFSKTLEPGFDYETAVNIAGLASRDLFNAVILIIDKLNSETHRIPIRKKNLLVIVDGSRPSYVALDTAAHIHRHGTCVVAALLVSGSGNVKGALIQTHLPTDLQRRCREQYKIEDHKFHIEVLTPHSLESVVDHIDDSMKANNCKILVLGIDTNLLGTENVSMTVQWASWKTTYVVVLVKSCCTTQPFTVVTMPRSYLLCVKTIDDIDTMFEAVVTLMRPGDTVTFISIVPDGEPYGDARETRYGFGTRMNWIAGATPEAFATNFQDWNAEANKVFYQRANELLKISHIPGSCVVRAQRIHTTVGQELCWFAQEASCDMMVLRRGVDREVSTECIRDAACSIILIN